MNHRRTMQAIALASLAAMGCSPDWYERDADRQITKIVEERKQQTLGYKPQTEAKLTTTPETTKRAYETVPVTVIPTKSIVPLERLKEQAAYEPLGPKVPGPENDSLDLVPEYYTAFTVSLDRMGPPSPGEISVTLDLMGAVEYGVTHARPYQDAMEELYLKALDVTLQRHLFDVIPFASTTVGYDYNNQGSNPKRAVSSPSDPTLIPQYKSAASVLNTFGVYKQLPYGGQITAEQLVNFVSALNDSTQGGDEAQTALKASIPLLKGAGMVNLDPLIDSERQLVYQVRAFETYRRAFSVDIASQFFQLVSQQQGIKNRRQSYESLTMLCERSQAMYLAGRMQFLDVQRARQNLLTAENNLIDAINQYQASMDSFKISVGMPVEADLEIVPVELKVDVPEVDNSIAAETALKFRLDLQTARDRVDDARRGVDKAKNGLLADVNLNAYGMVGNFAGDYDPWFKYNADSAQYGASVTIRWPLDQVAERNDYRKSLILLERSFRGYITAREEVISSVRQVARSIRLALVTVEIQKRSVDLNQKRLDLANEKMIQGTAQVLDYVDAQNALLNAQDSYDRARANLQTQVLQYLRDTGTLRLNPGAGELGRAMDRAVVKDRDVRWFDEIEKKLKTLER